MRSMPFHLVSRRFEPAQVRQLTTETEKDGLVTDGSQLYFSDHTGAPPLRGLVSPDGRANAYASGNVLYITLDEGRSNRLLAMFEIVPTSLQRFADGKHLRLLLRQTMTSESKQATPSCSAFQLRRKSRRESGTYPACRFHRAAQPLVLCRAGWFGRPAPRYAR